MAASSSTNTVDEPAGSLVEPIGEHRVTIVWLHDRADHFLDSVRFVKSLNLNNVKWICPRVLFSDSWYNSESNIKDYVGDAFDPTFKLVADVFSKEPENVIKGVGGFGFGAAIALYFATNCAIGHGYYTTNLRVVVGINGWLSNAGSLRRTIEAADGAAARAASQSILLTHDDRIAPYAAFGEEADVSLREAGFGDVMFVPFARLGRTGQEISLNVMEEVKNWLGNKLPLDEVLP